MKKNSIYFCNEKYFNLTLNQCTWLIFFSMLYLGIMISNTILTEKWIALGRYFVFGGAFVSPFLFFLGDIIAEIFGYSIAEKIIWCGFISQTIFAFIVKIFLHTTAPVNWHEAHSFCYVLDPLLRIDISGFVAFVVSSTVNISIITKWKILMRGRFFWLRSIGSSTVAEAVYSAIAILMIGFGTLSFSSMLPVIEITCLIKIIYSLILAYPGAIFVNYLKDRLHIDVYETNPNMNPFLMEK